MSLDVKKKVKKIAINIFEATITELLKELIIHRLLRRKHSRADMEEAEVPCNIVDRFKFFLNEFDQIFQRTRSHNIVSIINSVCSQLGSHEITKQIQQIEKEYKWVESEFHDAKESFENFEKYGEEEWFSKATKHLYDAVEYYSKCAKSLDELLLAYGKPQTLKTALKLIDTYYVPMRKWFNYLICEFYRLGQISKSVHFSHDKYDALLPDIPSKENLMILLKATKEETIVEKL